MRETAKKGNKKLPWSDIAKKVVNLKGEQPSPWLVASIYLEFNRKSGRRIYKYKKSGQKKWKVTKPVENFLLKRLLQLRKECICTSSLLARELLAKKSIEVEESTIRKVLKRKGYRWLPRAQKRKFSEAVMKEREAFAQSVKKLSPAGFRAKLALAIDGVVLTIPPKNVLDRENYCHYGETHMWRKKDERAVPELAGADPYAKQVPLARALPMWGAISEGGFQELLFHAEKKVTTEEWAHVVEKGKLTEVIKKLNPTRPRGPWQMLCDGESFLHAPQSRKAYKRCKVKVWKIPPKSPDLNPIEKFWAWLRKELRARDVADLKARRPVPGKTAYRQRVRNILRSAKAQRRAAACAKGLRNVCIEVVLKKGAASRG